MSDMTNETRKTTRLLTTDRLSVYLAIDAERDRQNAIFPASNLPHWKISDGAKLAVLTEELGEVARATLEHDRRAQRIELVQLAAVAVAWLEALDAEERERDPTPGSGEHIYRTYTDREARHG